MNENITQLRKDAYKIWGISTKEVIYDEPLHAKRMGYDRFEFKINYSNEHESWPRSYKLSEPEMQEGKLVDSTVSSRIILPIILMKDYGEIKFNAEAWFDMSEDMHTEILLMTEHPRYEKLGFFKKFANLFLTKKSKFKEEINMEDYVYEVKKDSKEYSIAIL